VPPVLDRVVAWARAYPAQLSMLAVAAILLAQLGLSDLWLREDGVARGCDVQMHLNSALKLHDALAQAGLARTPSALFVLLRSAKIGDRKWPKLTYLVSSIGVSLSGARGTRSTILFSSAAFLAVLELSLLFLGQRLYSLRTGLLACALFAVLPLPTGFARSFGLDLPLTGMVTLALLLLARRGVLLEWPRALLAGLAAGGVLMTKIQGVFFLAGPLVLVVARELRALRRRRGGDLQRATSIEQRADAPPRRALLLGLAAFAAPPLLLLVYYLQGHFGDAFAEFLQHTGERGTVTPSMVTRLFGVETLLFYPVNLVLGVSPPLFAVLLASLAARRHPAFVWVSLAVPLVVFTFLITTKWERFLLPLFPLLALVAAHGLLGIPGAVARRAAVSLALLLGAAQLVGLSFDKRTHDVLLSPWRRLPIPASFFIPHPPIADNWEVQTSRVAVLVRHRRLRGSVVRLGILENPALEADNGLLYEYHARAGVPGLDLRVFHSAMYPGDFVRAKEVLDYLLVPTPFFGQSPRVAFRSVLDDHRNLGAMKVKWPKFSYRYDTQGIERWASEVERWRPVLDLSLHPRDVRVLLFENPARARGERSEREKETSR
jgi:hypothetical protein